MAIRFLGRPIQIAGSVLAVGTVIAAVGCEMGSLPTVPSSESAGTGSGVSAGGAVAQVQAAKVAMCHVTGNGHYQWISISVHAIPGHYKHGDAQPGEPVPARVGYRFDSTCYQEAIPPPTPPPTPPSTSLGCPCWNNYSESQLLSLLNASAVVGSPLCLTTLSGVLLSPDNGVAALVYASNSINACRLRLNGQDTGLVMPLTQAESNQCYAEAVSFIPHINWCR
jgi:hypothetical protein